MPIQTSLLPWVMEVVVAERAFEPLVQQGQVFEPPVLAEVVGVVEGEEYWASLLPREAEEEQQVFPFQLSEQSLAGAVGAAELQVEFGH